MTLCIIKKEFKPGYAVEKLIYMKEDRSREIVLNTITNRGVRLKIRTSVLLQTGVALNGTTD
jgi:hypothetical protein